MQSKGWFHQCLGFRGSGKRGGHEQDAEKTTHGANLGPIALRRKPGSRRRGFALLEVTGAMSLLTLVGLLLLKLTLNALAPRQWTLQQTLSDAYLTYERSYAERIPFSTLTAASGSPWPAFPTVSTSTVEVGRLPGGAAVTGTLTRTRIPDPNNFPIDGGTGTTATNPANLKVWQVQSVLTYKVADRTYAKSRTVIRSQ